ncbi:formate dehydrogenase accessory protein FdhE [Thauera sp.]|jgi:FdhE protein|uniref:formate dehydrogenase accessory protein FdhE n=1 Tax=Thauera sp. TaxID=1905334 RepID=UPI0026237517|nr:formate dehydrogenase accessory protein FdhE [Thauera sp.]MCK6408191.1 formate dehydrogenase accessory protein FdhE [Thauera sp.]
MNSPLSAQHSTGEAPAIVLPEPHSIFLARAERFDALALHHSLGEWLGFVGRLSRAQHKALEAAGTDLTPPAAETLERARKHRIPPVSVATFQRPLVWHDILRNIVGDLLENAPIGARETLDALLVTSAEELDKLAEKQLNGEPERADMARLPYIAAAMQVVFTSIASQLDASALPLMEAHSTCPVCGSHPVVSVIRSEGPVAGLRYVHCTLCNTEWQVPHATCVSCGDQERVTLHEVDGDDGIARAESCGACESYMKLIVQGRNVRVDPIADDLASVALDVLVDDAGFVRSGPNYLLIGTEA